VGQLLLVRHGQASFGSDDYDALSPLGFEQSRMLGEALAARRIEAATVLAGGKRRHRETAETCAAAAGWTGELVVDEGWDEFDFLSVLAVHPPAHGVAEPTKAEFQRWFEEATAAWIAGVEREYAETFLEFNTRVLNALERAAALAEDGPVAVFSSGGPIAWAVSAVLTEGGSADLWTRLNRMSVNASLTRLVSGSRGLNLLTYNDQSHLDGVHGAVTYR
jgi:broad specificity phosphatase PhoE